MLSFRRAGAHVRHSRCLFSSGRKIAGCPAALPSPANQFRVCTETAIGCPERSLLLPAMWEVPLPLRTSRCTSPSCLKHPLARNQRYTL